VYLLRSPNQPEAYLRAEVQRLNEKVKDRLRALG
jgi:hypothetical protein